MFKSHVKLAVLKELKDKSQSGYELMKNIGQFEGKRPSAGYIYPLLSELQQNEFVSVKDSGRRKIYHLNVKGSKLLNDLSKHQKDMAQSMARTFGPLADKEEFKEISRLRKEIANHRINYIRDIELVHRFHRSLSAIYDKKDAKLSVKIRKILEDSIKKIESLK